MSGKCGCTRCSYRYDTVTQMQAHLMAEHPEVIEEHGVGPQRSEPIDPDYYRKLWGGPPPGSWARQGWRGPGT
jgi:hypothetical protein